MESPKKAWVTGIDQIWLINLARRRDRLDRFLQAQVEMTGRINFLAAYDGKNLKLTPALARLFAPNNFDWHKPTMGCALSHLSLWQRLAVEPNPSASYLILEDDARLEPSWVRKVEEAFLSGSVPADWEVLYLGGILPQYRESFERNVQPVNQLVARVHPDCKFGNNPSGYFHFCAYSYILSQRGARRLLDLLHFWNGYWLQADFVAAYHTPDLSPPRRIYFFHPLIAESFQDTAQGLARPYDENQGQENKVDSDIWKNDDRFGPDEIAAIKTDGLPIDVPAALGWVPDDPLSVKVLALQEASQRLTEVKKPSPSKIQGIDKIWVINLERRKDRLEKFLINNPDIAEQVSILKAYDGKKLSLTPKIGRLFAPNDFAWNKATMGCSLSHLELWHKLANESDEVNAYLILEDDTKLSPGWQDIVQKAFQENQVPENWDILYLGGVLPRNMENFGKLIEPLKENLAQVKENSLFGQNPPNRYFHFGAFAYILSKHGARQILELMRLGNGAWMQADYLASYIMPENHAMTRRVFFFNPFLAHCYQDLEEGFAKSYGETSQHVKVDSDIWHEGSQFDARFAASVINLEEPYDIGGALLDAQHEIAHFIALPPAKISLLHATRGRPEQALEARRLWLERAIKSERVEHIFAFDHDDESSSHLKKYHHVIQMHNGYSVGAWNLAARHSTGEILIQLSDDWDPPVGWDILIEEKLDTSRESVLWVNDAHREDDLLCIAILTRKYYDKNGLFDPRFKNVYSDDDFSIRAKKAGAVIDARDIKITHLHPTAGHSEVDDTYRRGNAPEEYDRAKWLFEEIHRQVIVYSQNDEQSVIEKCFGDFKGIV
jgi:GR25 family glycosyltransferase involved in LPS biosynthesis